LTETRSPTPDQPSVEAVPSSGELPTIAGGLLGAFLSLMPDAAVAIDASGRIVSANEQAELLFGYPSGSLAGVAVEALVPERVRSRHRQHRSSYVAAPQSRSMGAGLELTGRRRDASEFPVDISLAPITSTGQQLVVAAVRDVSEQRAATAAQAQLAAIVRSSIDAIIATTIEGQITSWNPAAEDLLGYGQDEILGQHIAALVPDGSSIVLEELLDMAHDGSAHSARDTRWNHRDGHEVDVAVSISPLRDGSGMLLGFSSVVRDISERKRGENELRRLLAEEERLERQHAATSEIRLALLAETPLDDALMLICEQAGGVVDAPVSVICIREADGLRIRAGTGAATEIVGMLLPAGSSFSEQVLDAGRVLQAVRRSDASTVDVPRSIPDGPMLGIPIVGAAIATGALVFMRELGAPEFTAAELVVAESLAAQAALAFELERAQSDREQMTLVADRERIARDLHDHIIQQLFATGMWLQSTLPLVERDTVRDRISDAIDSLDDSIREIRNTIYGLSRQQSGDARVRSQIVELASEAQAALGFEPSIRLDGPVDIGIPSTVVPHLLAVVRETLSNAARHAQARVVVVDVALVGRMLSVAVTDDGIGIGAPVRSSGLKNLQQRALLLGGTFEISAMPSGGTRVDWQVPIGE
jgi:PAS domain S-box-containing protein